MKDVSFDSNYKVEAVMGMMEEEGQLSRIMLNEIIDLTTVYKFESVTIFFSHFVHLLILVILMILKEYIYFSV